MERADAARYLGVNDQAARRISTGRLSASQRLHFRPIEVVVYDLPSGACAREILSQGRLGA